MKKQLLFTSLFFGAFLSVNAQNVLFEDNFDSYTSFIIDDIGEFTQIDVDGAPVYFVQGTDFENAGYTGTAIVFDYTQTTPALTEAWAAYSGANSLNFFAAVSQNDENPELVGPNDDWFVTPLITLGESNNNVSFWAKSLTDQYGLERMRVAVSTTGNTDPADFTYISGANDVQVPIDWTNYTYSLDAYAGQSVYIAINYRSDDAFVMLVDDFAVTEGELGTEDFLNNAINVYPNPADNFINVSAVNNVSVDNINIVDLNGRVVKNVDYSNVSQLQLNISDLSSGMYLMNINSAEGVLTKKIVKKLIKRVNI